MNLIEFVEKTFSKIKKCDFREIFSTKLRNPQENAVKTAKVILLRCKPSVGFTSVKGGLSLNDSSVQSLLMLHATVACNTKTLAFPYSVQHAK
jgi:hypothetical protein